MPKANNGTVELHYETTGSVDDVPLVLIMGLGEQLITWPDDLCDAFADRGFFVLRLDNRDVGLSTYFDEHPVDLEELAPRFFAGEKLIPPYTIEAMADDVAAVLDAAGVESAHIMGASMGGMIAQAVAIRHPERTRSLISIMSTTGDLDVGQPHEEALGALLMAPGEGRDAVVEQGVHVMRVIGSPVHFDEDRARADAGASFDRAFHPAGTVRQLLAILTAESRTAGLQALDVPALVIHGAQDPLVDPSGGQRTHEALRNSELVMLPDAGHDLPELYWPNLIEKITALASSADRARSTTSA